MLLALLPAPASILGALLRIHVSESPGRGSEAQSPAHALAAALLVYFQPASSSRKSSQAGTPTEVPTVSHS